MPFEAAYVEHEGNPACLRIRSEGKLCPPVSHLVVDAFCVFERLEAPVSSYGAPSTTKFLKYWLVVLLILQRRRLI